RPQYNRLQGVLALSGPLRIPRLLRNGPNMTLNYQWTRNSDASTRTGLMPTTAERNGDFSNRPVIYDPQTGGSFPNNTIPASRISPQAKSLLDLYPLPNFAHERYNYQIPVIGATHQDSLQLRGNQRLSQKNQLSGNLSYQSTRIDNPNIFNFLDVTDSTGINSGLSWLHTFQPRLYAVFGMQFSRLSSLTTPYFANRANVSGEAGIAGNNQDAVNWGPPALSFSSGIAALTDAQYSRTANQTTGVSVDAGWGRGRHTFLFGGALRWQQFNVLSQEDPRGMFTFTGASAGSDFAGFLLGIPDASSIAFGNADKYLRGTSTDAYINDDWRLRRDLP
ncbi:MAG TPA: TonB-dependent receptor, partial [Bryobacteraceae bacterium]|nr:TonB-dependent receptor [Bryobacteraceae bacterium]